MGNTVSRTAEYDDHHENHTDDLMDIVEDSDIDNETVTSELDDWSVDEQGERVVPGSEIRSSDATLSYAERFAALLAENNIIAKAFQDEFEWVKRNDASVLSAWLVASKIYRDAHASRKHARFEDTADDIPYEWREVVKRASVQPVEDVAYDHYRLEHMFYLAGRIKSHSLKFQHLVGKFLQEGFDLHDLLLKVEINLEHLDTPKDAVHAVTNIFDSLKSEPRLLQVVPALRELFYEGESASTPLSPSNQLRGKSVGSPRSLLTARHDTEQDSTTSAPAASPEQDFIPFGSPSPTTSPLPGTPEDINTKILAAFGKEFRWFDKQRWPAPASWRFISALVYSQIADCNGDVDEAIWHLGGGILPEYSENRKAVIEAVEHYRHGVLVDTILPLLEQLPTAYCRRRLREVVDEGLRRHFDYHWLAEKWNERVGSSISRRESDIAVIAQIEEFKAWLQEQSAEQVLIEWVPELFDLLDEDTDSGGTAGIDEDRERPYKTISSIFGHEISFRDMVLGTTDNGDQWRESRPTNHTGEQEDDETRPTDHNIELGQEDDSNLPYPDLDNRPPHTPTSIPSTPRPSDIPSPSSPCIGQMLDDLRPPRPNSSSSRRLQSRYKDSGVKRVDPLRYQNRLEEPRRLPNTPTVSHQPPRPRSHARGPESRSCQACGRAFRNRVVKPAGPKSTSKKGSAAVRAAAHNSSSARYPTRVRKTPKKFNV